MLEVEDDDRRRRPIAEDREDSWMESSHDGAHGGSIRHFSLEELRGAVETISNGKIEVGSPVNSPVSTAQPANEKSKLLQ